MSISRDVRALLLSTVVLYALPVMALNLKVVSASSNGTIEVELTNGSQKPVRVWKDGNSWGAARWRLLVLRDEQMETLFQNPAQRFTRNFPAFSEIPPGGSRKQVLKLADGTWLSASGSAVALRRGDQLIVIYDVPKYEGWAGAQVTIDASNMNVWYGVVSARITVH